jgi:hypothetical protein
MLGDAASRGSLRKGVPPFRRRQAHSALGVALLSIGRAKRPSPARRARTDPGTLRDGQLGTVLFMRGKRRGDQSTRSRRLVPDDHARIRSRHGASCGEQFTRAIPKPRAIALDPKRAVPFDPARVAALGKVTEAIADTAKRSRDRSEALERVVNLATASRDPKTRGEARQALKTAGGSIPRSRVKADLGEPTLEKGPQGREADTASARKKSWILKHLRGVAEWLGCGQTQKRVQDQVDGRNLPPVRTTQQVKR